MARTVPTATKLSLLEDDPVNPDASLDINSHIAVRG